MRSCRVRRQTRTGPRESAGSPVSRPPHNPAVRSHNVFADGSGHCACTCHQRQEQHQQGKVWIFRRWNLREPRTDVYVDKDTPVQWFEAASIQRQSVFRARAVVDQPAADAGAAVRVFTGRLEGALQYVSTHTAEETFIHVAHKPVQIIAHPARLV